METTAQAAAATSGGTAGAWIIALIVLAIIVFLKKGPSLSGPSLTTIKKILPGSPKGNGEWKLNWVLGIAGVIILIWGIYSPIWTTPSLAEAGSWSWEYWLPLLLLWSIGTVLIVLNTKEAALKKLLLGILNAFVFLLFIGAPLLNWVESKKVREKAPEVAMLKMPPNGNSPFLKAIPGHPFSFTGENFTTHCVYADRSEGIVGNPERPCSDGPILYVYVRDTSGKENSVTYE